MRNELALCAAVDALESLHRGSTWANPGEYITNPEADGTCGVCAIGSVLLSLSSRAVPVSLNEVHTARFIVQARAMNYDPILASGVHATILKLSQEAFSNTELAMMEIVFEDRILKWHESNPNVSMADCSLARTYATILRLTIPDQALLFDRAHHLLTCVLQNIVFHGGAFTLPYDKKEVDAYFAAPEFDLSSISCEKTCPADASLVAAP